MFLKYKFQDYKIRLCGEDFLSFLKSRRDFTKSKFWIITTILANENEFC
jgi:hypothetical protein